MAERTFGGFKWDRSGYAAFMNSREVQSLVREKAERVCSAANAALPRDAGETESAEVMAIGGRLAHGCMVHTKGVRAARENAEHNTMLKCIDAAKG